MLPPRDGVREVEPQLRRYLQALQQRLPVECLAVFGSRARGDHWIDSDIDLVVVSAAFEGLPRQERIGLLLEDWRESPALEPLGYTCNELLRADHPVLLEALSDGRAIFDRGIWRQGQERLTAVLASQAWTRIPGGWKERLPG